MEAQHINKAKLILNKKVTYKSKAFTITNIKSVANKTVVSTDSQTFVFFPSEYIAFLEEVKLVTLDTREFRPHVTSQQQEAVKTNLAIYEPTASQKKVQDALINMLDKVQNNVEYIPQAKAVCDIANTMVNMEKTQIQLMQLARQIK